MKSGTEPVGVDNEERSFHNWRINLTVCQVAFQQVGFGREFFPERLAAAARHSSLRPKNELVILRDILPCCAEAVRLILDVTWLGLAKPIW